MKFKSYFGCRIHFKNGKNDRVTYFKTPEEAQAFFDNKKKEFKAISECDFIADTLTYYEDKYAVLSFEDTFFPV